MRVALGRLGGWKFFPSGNVDAMKDVAAVLAQQFETDAELQRGVGWLLFESGASEWPGAFEFKRLTECAARAEKPIRSGDGGNPHAVWVPDWNRERVEDEGEQTA
jgi:hypothetical protein